MLIKVKRTQHLQLATMEHSCPCLIKHLNVTKQTPRPSELKTQQREYGMSVWVKISLLDKETKNRFKPAAQLTAN